MSSDDALNGDDSSDSTTWELATQTSRLPSEPRPMQNFAAAGLRAWLEPLKPGTKNLYMGALRDLAKWMGAEPAEPEIAAMLLELDQARARVLLERYVSERRAAISDSSLKSRLSAIQSWLRWAEEHGLGGPGGAFKVRHQLVVDTPAVELVGMAEVQTRIHKLLKSKKTGDIRDALIVAFLAITGVRRQELERLQLEHFTGRADQLKVRVVRKGRAIDLLEVPRPLAELLGRWLDRVPWAAQREGPVLGSVDVSRQYVTRKGLTASSIYKIVRGLGCGSPHALRRMAGSWAVQFGHHGTPADMESLRGFLGHRSLEATHRYTRRVGDSGREIRSGIAAELIPCEDDFP